MGDAMPFPWAKKAPKAVHSLGCGPVRELGNAVGSVETN